MHLVYHIEFVLEQGLCDLEGEGEIVRLTRDGPLARTAGSA